MTDGERLREARLRAGLQQAQVAEATGLSRQYYNDVEHGRREPPDDTYARLCAAVGLASDRPAARLAAVEAELVRLRTAALVLLDPDKRGMFLALLDDVDPATGTFAMDELPCLIGGVDINHPAARERPTTGGLTARPTIPAKPYPPPPRACRARGLCAELRSCAEGCNGEP